MDPEICVISVEEPSVHQRHENTIFCAPDHMKYNRGSDFAPKLVSIGPYYHGLENLKPMEELKVRCKSDFHEKGIIINDRPDELHESERIARRFYKQQFNHGSTDFVEMLVLDSFFIIRIILSYFTEKLPESMAFLDVSTFLGVNVKEVRSDLLLLENQIPFFFIRMVYYWLFPQSWLPTLETVLIPFIHHDMPWSMNHGGMSSAAAHSPWSMNPGHMSSEAAHLLELYWRCSSPPEMNEILGYFREDWFVQRLEQLSREETHIPNNEPKVIPNATELHQMAGIKFKKLKENYYFREGLLKRKTKNYYKGGLDVIFSDGIMWMPRLIIDSSQTTLLVNLIAFEQSILPRMRFITTYMKLMDTLIDSEKDVELLDQCKVIHHKPTDHKKAAVVFNDIGKLCLIDWNDSIFSELIRDVQHSSSKRAKRKNYFNRAYLVYAAVVGVTVLILSVLQTFYTIYPYYHPRN